MEAVEDAAACRSRGCCGYRSVRDSRSVSLSHPTRGEGAPFGPTHASAAPGNPRRLRRYRPRMLQLHPPTHILPSCLPALRRIIRRLVLYILSIYTFLYLSLFSLSLSDQQYRFSRGTRICRPTSFSFPFLSFPSPFSPLRSSSVARSIRTILESNAPPFEFLSVCTQYERAFENASSVSRAFGCIFTPKGAPLPSPYKAGISILERVLQ